MKPFVEFLRALFIMVVAMILVSVGMLLAENTVSQIFEERFKKTMEVLTGLICAAIWIWLYLLFQTKLAKSHEPRQERAANTLEELSGSIARQVSSAFSESSKRVTLSFYVAVISISAGAIMLLSTILPIGSAQSNTNQLQLVVGGFSSLLGSTLFLYYRDAAKQHQSLINRAIRLDDVMHFFAQLKEEPRIDVRNRLRTQGLDVLLRLAMVRAGDPLPSLTFDETIEEREDALDRS